MMQSAVVSCLFKWGMGNFQFLPGIRVPQVVKRCILSMDLLLESIDTLNLNHLWYNNNLWPRKRLGRTFKSTFNLSILVLVGKWKLQKYSRRPGGYGVW